MKIKIKQSVYIANLGIQDAGYELEINDIVGRSLVEAGYAEEVEIEAPVVQEPVVEEKPKAKKKTAKKVKDGE